MGAIAFLTIFSTVNGARLAHQIGQNHGEVPNWQQHVLQVKVMHVALCDYHMSVGTLPVDPIFVCVPPEGLEAKLTNQNEQCIRRHIAHFFTRGPPDDLLQS